MDLDQLRTFLEVVRLKSFSRAAQTCYRTQPAISAQIRQLENELNTTLFDRLGTRIELTPAGRIFAEYARRILDLQREAQDRINELQRDPRGEILLAVSEADCIYLLPDAIREFKSRFPNVELQIERSYTEKTIQAVLENRADFGIAQPAGADRRLQSVTFHTDQICLIVPAGHRLSGRAQVVPQDLLGEPLLLPRFGRTRAMLETWLAPVADEIQVSMELESTQLVKCFTLLGLGLGFVPWLHCQPEVASGSLVAIPLGPEPVYRHLALIYRRDKALSKAALGLIKAVLEKSRPGCAQSGVPGT